MLVVGDSRVKELERVAVEMECEGWRIEFLHSAGAKLDQVVELVKGWRLRRLPEQPKIIVVVSLFHDLVVKTTLPDGKTHLRMADGVMGKGRYPALTGLEAKVREVNGVFKKWWDETEVLWIQPYPIDVRRWTEGRLKEGVTLSEDEIDQCHRLTLDLADWLDRANCVGTRIKGMGDRFVPWFVFWNDAKRSDVNFTVFKKEYEKGVKFGWINRTRTRDGFLPSEPLCKQTLKMLFRKARQAAPPPSSLKVPTPVEPRGSLVGDQLGEAIGLPVDAEVDDLMKNIRDVEISYMKVPSITGVHVSAPANLVREFSKTIYPCGHYLPFGSTRVGECSPVCPVCESDWTGCGLVETSFLIREYRK